MRLLGPEVDHRLDDPRRQPSNYSTSSTSRAGDRRRLGTAPTPGGIVSDPRTPNAIPSSCWSCSRSPHLVHQRRHCESVGPSDRQREYDDSQPAQAGRGRRHPSVVQRSDCQFVGPPGCPRAARGRCPLQRCTRPPTSRDRLDCRRRGWIGPSPARRDTSPDKGTFAVAGPTGVLLPEAGHRRTGWGDPLTHLSDISVLFLLIQRAGPVHLDGGSGHRVWGTSAGRWRSRWRW